MTETGTIFVAVSITTLVGLVGLVWSRIEFSELRAEIRGIWSETTNIRERMARIETTLGLPSEPKKEKVS
jgi:hypothetical protein